MNCSSPIDIGLLVMMAIGNHTWSSHYNCVDFSFALGNELKSEGCDFRLVTGWNAPAGTIGRKWHRWIETPDFTIEPQAGIINPNAYQKSYSTDWNWVHRYGK